MLLAKLGNWRDSLTSWLGLLVSGTPSVNLVGDIPLDDKVQKLMSKIKEEITELNISGKRLSSPKLGVHSVFANLKVLDIRGNSLKEVKEGIEDLEFLQVLDISNNPLEDIPSGVFKLKSLLVLRAVNIILEHLPDEIGNLEHLEVLDIAGHNLPSLPTTLERCSKLEELNLSGMPWLVDIEHLDLRAYGNKYINTHYTRMKYRPKLLALYDDVNTYDATTLRADAIEVLNDRLFKFFNRINKAEGGVSTVVTKLTQLKTLTLAFLPITSIPETIKGLKELTKLDLSHNPDLTTVSPQLSDLPLLSVLSFDGCGLLEVPPKEIVQKGTPAMKLYFQGLLKGSVKCRRTKLMLIGHGGAGKTSLLRALTGDPEPLNTTMTDGIDIRELVLQPEGGANITYSAWDFAGQTVYYNTHQFFLSSRAVYLLLWNIRLGHEYAGLDFWLSSVTCHAPHAKIIVVGTHIDEASKVSIPEQEIKRKFKQVEDFFVISSKTTVGISELKAALVNVTLKERYMDEEVPRVWLNLERDILAVRQRGDAERNLLSWAQMKDIGAKHGIVDNDELRQAVEFLHGLGTVQYFSTHFLKSQVVINPQWIMDAMKCVVSVRSDIIKEGRLKHGDLATVWGNYPITQHKWLLRLTESFDLTFPILGAAAYLVPCLMSFDTPQFDWPEEEGDHETETRIIYRFGYLPAGLFNRSQVRLYQYCDSTVIWKRGCLLRKHNLKALFKQLGESEIEVRVRGSQPTNLAFLIHEVISSLVTEAFQGVSYDFSMPCPSCLAEGATEVAMLRSSKVHRAASYKVPFIQCNQAFHVLSIEEIQAIMPPEKDEEFDLHLMRTVRKLGGARDDMLHQVLMLHSRLDVCDNGREGQKVSPAHLWRDLKMSDLNVELHDSPEDLTWTEVTVAVKAAKVVLVCLSRNFVQNEKLCGILRFIQETLLVRTLIVILDDGKDWQEGVKEFIQHHNQVRVYKQYDATDLANKLKLKMSESKNSQGVFVSYCWKNSHDAVKRGTECLDRALGWEQGDPRAVAAYLKQHGLDCWLDTTSAGKGLLFSDIVEGLQGCKVMLAFVSDEYVNSKTCMKEFRFAQTLGKPVVLVAAGTGRKWRQSEVIFHTMGEDEVIFMQQENTEAYDKVLERVRSHAEKAASVLPATPSHQDTAVLHKELLQLAQSNLLRHLSACASHVLYPRLLVVDMTRDRGPTSTATSRGECEQTSGVSGGDVTTARQEYVLSVLCEHDEGWHVPSGAPHVTLPRTRGEDPEHVVQQLSRYLARLYGILEHCDDVSLTILSCPEGLASVRSIRKEAESEEYVGFEGEYRGLVEATMTSDAARLYGQLKPYRLATGRVVWLCSQHGQGQPECLLDDTDVPGPSDYLGGDGELGEDQSKEGGQETPADTSQPSNSAVPGPSNQKTVAATSKTSRACVVS